MCRVGNRVNSVHIPSTKRSDSFCGDLASYEIGHVAFADSFNFQITQVEVDPNAKDVLTEIESLNQGIEVRHSLCSI